MEFPAKKLIKIHLIDGAFYAYYFSKNYIVWYRIRQDNSKFTVSFPGKTGVVGWSDGAG